MNIEALEGRAGELMAYIRRIEGLEERLYQVTGLIRFLTKVRPVAGGCIEWTSCISPQGYGEFSWRSAPVLAHRWIYEQTSGPLPAGLVIDHLCRNRACVNPDHLEAVTMGENTARGLLYPLRTAKARLKTHCDRGHPLFGENLARNRKGHRYCKTCQREAANVWRARNRERVNELQRIRRVKCQSL